MEDSAGTDSNEDSVQYLTYNSLSAIAASLTIIALPIIVIVRKVYKNYSSMLMLATLELMAVDVLVMAALRLNDYFKHPQKASYINAVASTYIFSCVSWLLLLQWY